MLYSSLTLSLPNNSAQNLLRNLRSQFVISFSERLQSIKSNHLKKACTHCFVDQIFTLSIKMTRFKNLQVTNIITLNSHLVSGSVSTKSNVYVKKSTSRDFIGCRDL